PLEGHKVFCNVGSVGQRRDTDWRACYGWAAGGRSHNRGGGGGGGAKGRQNKEKKEVSKSLCEGEHPRGGGYVGWGRHGPEGRGRRGGRPARAQPLRYPDHRLVAVGPVRRLCPIALRAHNPCLCCRTFPRSSVESKRGPCRIAFPRYPRREGFIMSRKILIQ